MNTTSSTLNTRDLAVGQKLILLKQRANRWGNGPTEFTTETVKVEKILKNRLVIELPGGGLVRLIVEFSKSYTYRNGEVSMDLEGSRSRRRYYSTPTWYKSLWTVDDPELAERIEKLEDENTRRQVRIDAENALQDFKSSLSVENAEAAIVALQAWIANQK